MPTVATSNPSLTMAALALRSTEAIHRDLLARHRSAPAQGAPAQGAAAQGVAVADPALQGAESP